MLENVQSKTDNEYKRDDRSDSKAANATMVLVTSGMRKNVKDQSIGCVDAGTLQ